MGWSEDAIERMVHSGTLTRALPNTFTVLGAPCTWDQGLALALAWAGEGSAASHGAAARKLGLSGFDYSPVEISTTIKKRAAGLCLPNGEPLIVHRVDEYFLRDIRTIENCSVTTPRRTILDLTGANHRRSERALDDALFKGLTTLGDMCAFYEESWTRGRRGIAILRDRLAQRTLGYGPTQTDLEDLYVGIVIRFNLPQPIRQYPMVLDGEDIRIDFGYPRSDLLIECDSYAWHGDRAAFDRDRDRDNRLRALGWTVFRFTYSKLKFEPEGVAVLVRAHLSAD
jgi:very-short-patch-repair endonuclease